MNRYFNHLNIHAKVVAWMILSIIGCLIFIISGCKENKSQESIHNNEVTTSDIIVDSIYMEALDRWRSIRIYLPKGYRSSQESYPVIYMLDGQNLFEDSTSYVGEWHLDESMDSLIHAGIQPAIIVGIDHGQDLRMNEYSPYNMERWGNGEGKETMEFIVNQLKPLIDDTYRTMSDRAYTLIGGSSMGGLMSFYAISQFPETFSKALVFSPSFWISDEVEELIETIDENVKIYLSIGSEEGEDMVRLVTLMADKLKDHGLTEQQLHINIVEGMGHNERLWTMEFPKAITWIFNN